jgi:hypothetical protein
MTSVHNVTVKLDDATKTYTAEFQTAESFAKAWQSVLKRAYKIAEVRCCCRGVGEKRLAVKYFAGSDKFSLAKFGGSATQHAADCRFSLDSDIDGPDGGSATGVINVQRDGSVKIRLEIGMSMRDPKQPDQMREPSTPRAPGNRQAAMRLGGLLGYLWEQATLNQWRPYWAGRRSMASVFRRLQTNAEGVISSDVQLADQILLPAMRPDSPEAARNAGRVLDAITNKRRMLVIAPLASYTAERAERMGEGLKISGFHGIPLIFMSDGHWPRLCKRYQAVIAGWKAGHTTIVIAQIEVWQKAGRRGASLLDAALMSVSANWIPVESSYEHLVAERLVDEGRSFYKPLRYNQDESEVHPDFVLLDCERGEVPMEVFGRTDDVYLARKREKEEYYDRRYGVKGWWRWDATAPGAQQSVPAFPPMSQKATDSKN